MATVQQIPDGASFQSAISALPPSTLAVLYFHVLWAAPCKQMAVVLDALASTYATDAPVKFLALDADELYDVSEQYECTAVPLIVLQSDGKVLETVSGSDATKVRAAVEKYIAPGGQKAGPPPAQIEHTSGEALSEAELNKKLAALTNAWPVMLFMKGTSTAPQCGFSRKMVELLRSNHVDFGFFNILADDEVRQGLKEFSKWPTFPQLYVMGKFEGGLDIIEDMFVTTPNWLKDSLKTKTSEQTKAVADNGGV